MAYIIDDTFFQRELEIPNKDEINSKSLTTLNQFIDEKCRLFMRDALGLSLYNQLDALLVNGLLPTTVPTDPLLQKFWRLVNGTTYTKDSVTHVWDGLRVVKGSYKTSVLAYYTYYYWLENEVSYMSGVGEAKGNPKGAIMVNSIRRMTEVWNKMVEMNQCNIYNDYFNRSIWSNQGYDIYEYKNHDVVSLIQYLTDNPLDFANICPRHYEVKNQLGI